jgi:CRISPR-associated protein Cas1
MNRRCAQHRATRLFQIDKKEHKDGRTIGLLHSSDALLHRTLHTLLAPILNRMFEHASVGYRPGLSIQTARARIQAAIRAGAQFAVRADVETFFDAMDWAVLEAALRRALPFADDLTFQLIGQCIRAPTTWRDQPVLRTRGVLQGSALSPLLANLYLDCFDERMTNQGYRLTRYGDDFVILTDTREEAEKALAYANTVLEPLKLHLHPEKTAITPLDLGFNFLGLKVSSVLDEETVERSALRKSLFIKETYAFTGLDGDSIVVRKKDELLARLPLHRLAEIVFLGNGSVSTALLQKCASLRIPVSFCSPAGWYSSTLRPDSRSWFGLIAEHTRRHEALGEGGRLIQARRIVEAKLRNYRHWLRSLPQASAKETGHKLESLCHSLADATTVEAVRGVEGLGGRLTFQIINGLVLGEGFASKQRLPREKPDRYNTLLDMLYSLLFTRLNVLLRGAGLNPYLGFLHSPQDSYESLVCDLQEPFRCRMDRLALKLLNRKELIAEGFENVEGRGWRLTSKAVGVVIEAFEREEQVRLAGEPSTFGQLLAGQIQAFRNWVEGRAETPAYFLAEIFTNRPRKVNLPA